jgi:PAS domain S-box-containing protein
MEKDASKKTQPLLNSQEPETPGLLETDPGQAGRLIYQAIYRQSSIGTVLYTHDGCLLDMNPAALEILGLIDLNELKKINLFGDPNFPKNFKESVQRGETATFTAPFDFDRIRQSHKVRTLRRGIGYLEFQIIPLVSENRQVLGLLGLIVDLTEHKANEDALSESEGRYRMLFDSIGDALIVHDFEGKILDVNRTTLERLGYERNALINQPLRTIVPASQAGRIGENVAALINNGSDSFEGEQLTKDGRILPVEINATVIEYNGQPAVMASVRDITERKIAEKRIFELNERFSKTFEINPMPLILSFYEDGRILDVNRSFLKIFGFRKEETIGQTTIELGILAAEDRERLLDEQKQREHVRHFKIRTQTRHGIRLEGLMAAEVIMLGTRKCLLCTFAEIHSLNQPQRPSLF